jgi:hypothetical protein
MNLKVFLSVWNFVGGELVRSQTAHNSPSRTSSEDASFRFEESNPIVANRARRWPICFRRNS